MQLDVQWFFATLINEELVTKEACIQLIASTGNNADLETVAQAALDMASTGLTEDDSNQVLGVFQQAIEYAQEQAETGELPPEHLLLEAPRPKIKIASRNIVDPLMELGAAMPATSTHSNIGQAIQPHKAPEPHTMEPHEPEPAAEPESEPEDEQKEKATESHSPAPHALPPMAKIEKTAASTAATAAAVAKIAAMAPAGGQPKIKAVFIEPVSKPVSPGWEGMPDFNHLGKLSDQEIKDFVMNLLREVRKRGASDLHLSALANPFVRHCSENKCLSDHILTAEEAMRLNCVMLTEEQHKSFKANKDLNYALALDIANRFRVCLMIHKDGAAGAYRLVPEKIMSLEELGFNAGNRATIERFLDYHNGLVLVTGAIGSGKTTTLASMVNIVNSKRFDHVITVEDPIEIVQHSIGCNVTQREVRNHTTSYKAALKGALREDPDVIVIGELHDLETIEMAITASETGHLVIGTLHTCDSANTLNRLLDVFPPTQQPQIRAMTAGSLRGIICQRLVPTVDGSMTVAAEILVNNTAVGNIISEGRTHQLRAVLQTGQNAGMVTMDASILDLYKQGRISQTVARYNIRGRDVRDEFNRLVAIEGAKNLQKNK